MKISPKNAFSRVKGLTGFTVVIMLMLSATLFLSICCISKAAGSGWQGPVSSAVRTDDDLPTGFIVIEMEKAYLMDSDTISSGKDGEILGIGPLPADASFEDEGIILKEVTLPEEDQTASVAETEPEGSPKEKETVNEDNSPEDEPVLEEVTPGDYVAGSGAETRPELPEVSSAASEDAVSVEEKSVAVTLEEKTPQWQEHVVKTGDNLTGISHKYGITPRDIVAANGLKNPDMLQKGQLLLIPSSGEMVAKVREEVERRKAEELEKRNRVKPVKVTTYIVANGDSLWSIANKFNLSIDSLFGSNALKNPDYLKPGLALRVPNQDGIFYKVKKGDSLDGISKKYKLTGDRIKKANPDKDFSKLQIGQEIFVPGASPAVSVYTSSSSGSTRTYSRSFRWPVMGKINSPFGWRRHPITKRRSFHTGIDIKARTGILIRAAKAGKVAYSGWMGGYGRVVVINHGGGYSTLYAHCSRLLVRKGTKVAAGKVIAKVGASGRVTGPHLHFEVRKNNKAINPLRVLR